MNITSLKKRIKLRCKKDRELMITAFWTEGGESLPLILAKTYLREPCNKTVPESFYSIVLETVEEVFEDLRTEVVFGAEVLSEVRHSSD